MRAAYTVLKTLWVLCFSYLTWPPESSTASVFLTRIMHEWGLAAGLSLFFTVISKSYDIENMSLLVWMEQPQISEWVFCSTHFFFLINVFFSEVLALHHFSQWLRATLCSSFDFMNQYFPSRSALCSCLFFCSTVSFHSDSASPTAKYNCTHKNNNKKTNR